MASYAQTEVRNRKKQIRFKCNRLGHVMGIFVHGVAKCRYCPATVTILDETFAADGQALITKCKI